MHYKSLILTEQFLDDVKNKANIYSLPFNEIIQTVAVDNSFSQLDYIQKFLEYDLVSVPLAWEKAVNNSKDFLNYDEKQLLIEFCYGLINCNREQISNHCDKYISQINNIILTMNKDREKNTKLTTVISMAIGITAILILI